MSNPGGDEEELKELVGHERVGRAEHDPEARDEAVWHEGHDPVYDDPESDAARGSWGVYLLLGIVLAIVAYVVYLVYS